MEKLEYPKPLSDFVYTTFNAFAERHPWVGEENIRPKSIAREMFEQFRSFAEYILDYELQRSEGLLLRHLNSVYKVLSQTVPDGVKSDAVLDMEIYLRTLLSQVDSSLADEWERMRDPAYQPFAGAAARAQGLKPPGAEEAARDITRDAKTFTAAVRTVVFTFLRAWSIGDDAAALAALAGPADAETLAGLTGPADAATVAAPTGPVDADGAAWTAERLREAWEAYRAGHDRLRLDPEARNLRHTHLTPAEDGRAWKIEQMLVDPEMANDWVAEFEVDLNASREAGQPRLTMRRLGALA